MAAVSVIPGQEGFDDWTCSSGKLIKWESLASHSDDIQCQLTCVTLKNELAFIFVLSSFCIIFAHMKKILFLHGFFATGSCPMAKALKEAFEEAAVVLTPDLPLHPKKALNEIRTPWLTSPLSSWSITTKPSISQAVTRLQSRR